MHSPVRTKPAPSDYDFLVRQIAEKWLMSASNSELASELFCVKLYTKDRPAIIQFLVPIIRDKVLQVLEAKDLLAEVDSCEGQEVLLPSRPLEGCFAERLTDVSTASQCLEIREESFRALRLFSAIESGDEKECANLARIASKEGLQIETVDLQQMKEWLRDPRRVLCGAGVQKVPGKPRSLSAYYSLLMPEDKKDAEHVYPALAECGEPGSRLKALQLQLLLQQAPHVALAEDMCSIDRGKGILSAARMKTVEFIRDQNRTRDYPVKYIVGSIIRRVLGVKRGDTFIPVPHHLAPISNYASFAACLKSRKAKFIPLGSCVRETPVPAMGPDCFLVCEWEDVYHLIPDAVEE
jgi:hypothetical protein